MSPRKATAAVFLGSVITLLTAVTVSATPANKAALEKHYDKFLPRELGRCATCHLPSDRKAPESLAEFPHNPFGDRLRAVRETLLVAGSKATLDARLKSIAHEDADGDGTDNESEILLGTNPGDAASRPQSQRLETLVARRAEFAAFLSAYRWEPLTAPARPPVPDVRNSRWSRNPIDAFVTERRDEKQLPPRPEASREVLLRRLYFDLIGLSPTPEEQHAFLSDRSADAYEKLVDRLLADLRHGERWGRHWMDVWRYSDWAGWTDGGQTRDRPRHIWRWRDWIVESLNGDKPYDRMIVEMLAADELAPDDTNALRATGFLVRNYKMLSREQWLEDTIKHTWQGFMGTTFGCAKCHDHMTEPISQKEYYHMRAVFEPHQVRTDKVPGETNAALAGLVRTYDVATNPPTWFYRRGDERHPETNHVYEPLVPAAFGGRLNVQPVKLPRASAYPDQREFVRRDVEAAARKVLADATKAVANARTNTAAKPGELAEKELQLRIAEVRLDALVKLLRAEIAEEQHTQSSEIFRKAAVETRQAQRELSVAEARLKSHVVKVAHRLAQAKADEAAAKTNGVDKATKALEEARKKLDDADKALVIAEKELSAPPASNFTPRPQEVFPGTSTGRRLAFARWVASSSNPLTARVAMNHLWLRHFGRGIVATPADFGRNGRAPSHPELLDWLANEFIARGWSMKAMHRLMVTSSTYRQASTGDEQCAAVDPDNLLLWRMNSRRLEAEVVRDNLLHVTGGLDLTMGGPDIDNQLGLTSKRRSLYLRLAAEKEVEFLKIFDGPSVTECYERKPSVVPQQALALANSELALTRAKELASSLSARAGGDDELFVQLAHRQVLARRPMKAELRLCREFLKGVSGKPETTPVSHGKIAPASRARENLILVLLNHSDFVTVR